MGIAVTATSAPVAVATPTTETASDGFNIDWSFIAKMEGTENRVYVPKGNDKKALDKSGPTIASGFDLGQISLPEFNTYNFSTEISNELKKFVGKRGDEAVKFVEDNPTSFTDEQINEINKKVKHKHAKRAETFYNEVVASVTEKFKTLPIEIQTPFTSVFFQYGTAKTLRGNLIAKDYLEGINTLLHFTTKTVKAEHRTTKIKTDIMPYLRRRCKEAEYLMRIITDDKDKIKAKKMIDARKQEYENATGKQI